MIAPVLDRVPATPAAPGPLGWQSAEDWIASLNATAQKRARGFHWVRIGVHGRVKHRLAWTDRPDGRRVYEPACHIGYVGDPADSVHPINSLAGGEFCNRLACVHASPADAAPRHRSEKAARQLELDLRVG